MPEKLTLEIVVNGRSNIVDITPTRYTMAANILRCAERDRTLPAPGSGIANFHVRRGNGREWGLGDMVPVYEGAEFTTPANG